MIYSRFTIAFLIANLLLLPAYGRIAHCNEDPPPLSPITLKKMRETGLNIVLVPEKNIFEQRKRYKYLTDYLSRKIGVPVHLEIVSKYSMMKEAFLEGRADAGFFGSFSYVLSHASAEIEPIARPVWLDGSSTYSGYLFVRKDSRISNINDMKGKTLVLVDRETTAGYIFQLFYLRKFGITDMSEYFSRIYYAGTHDAAAWAVYIGEADIGAAKDRIFKSLSEEYPDFGEKMVVLASSPEVPSNGLAVNKNMRPALKIFLRSIFLNMDKCEEGKEVLRKFGAQKFIATKDEDYYPLHQMIEELGIDLKTYTSEGLDH